MRTYTIKYNQPMDPSGQTVQVQCGVGSVYLSY